MTCSTSGATTACCATCQGTLVPGDINCGDCGTPCDPDVTRGFALRRPLTRGDTIQIDYDLLDKNGSPLDLTPISVRVWFTIKYYLGDADQNAVAQATLMNGGISFRDVSTSGHITVTIAAANTVNVAEGTTKLYYDLQVLDSTGRVTTVEKGLFIVDPDVTRATS